MAEWIRSRRALSATGVAVSLLVHGAVALRLRSLPEALSEAGVARPSQLVVMTARATEPGPEPPAVPLAPSPAPARRQAHRALAPRSEQAHPEPVEAAPLETSGVTLTNAGSGARWAAPGGDGSSRLEPTGSVVTDRPEAAPGRELSRASAPREVALGDLSRRPAPPSLDGLLRANYPDEARRRGIDGSAVVRLRIDADGRAQSCSIVTETGSGFGAACRRTVLGSAWSSPLDRNGRPVATKVSYTCRFRVAD